MSKTISYISDIRWFSSKNTTGKYQSVAEALKAHIKYIARASSHAEQITTHNLEIKTWEAICEKALSRNSRARVACKLTFALPNTLSAKEGLELMQDFLTQEQIFKFRMWDPAKKKTVPMPGKLTQNDFGVAVHDSNGVSGFRNLHAHVLISSRPAAGGSLRADKRELSLMHKKWREFLKKRGYEIVVNSDPNTRQHHVGPARLRSRDQRVKEEAMRELEMLTESYRALQRAQREEERYIEQIKEIQKRRRAQYEHEQRMRELDAIAARLASRIKLDLLGIIALVMCLSVLLRRRALTKECDRFKKQVEEQIKSIETQLNTSSGQGDLKSARECVKKLVSLKNRVTRERRVIETELAKAIPTPRIAAALGIDASKLKIKRDQNGRWLWFDPTSKRGGSNIDLVMQCLNLEFREAVEWILSNNNKYLKKLKEEEMSRIIKLEQLSSGELAELKKRYGLSQAAWAWSRAQFKRCQDGSVEPVWVKPGEGRNIILHGHLSPGESASYLIVADHPLHCAFVASTLPFPRFYGNLALSLNGAAIEADPNGENGELVQVLTTLIRRGLIDKNTKLIVAMQGGLVGDDISQVLKSLGLEPCENFSGLLSGVAHLDDFLAQVGDRVEKLAEIEQAQGQDHDHFFFGPGR